MRKDISFSHTDLTRAEFSDKYWKGGDPNYIGQYHTMTIEDGRDEREQLIINNIGAIWERMAQDRAENRETCKSNMLFPPFSKLF
jgi:hypothetical protein